MSILPPHIQGHNSSTPPSDSSLNPISEHGNNSLLPNNSPSRISSSQIGSQESIEEGHTHTRGRRNRRTTGTATGSPSTGRRGNMISGNHLLNFQYDHHQPQSRALPHAQPQRRKQCKRRPYNKDLFLQANYKFVLLDTGKNHSPDSMDPDKMLQWENIICVKYSTPSSVQCPICLEYPLCPQITSCGHIFCFPCILQYLLMGVDNHKAECFKRCPLCFVMISPKELYTVYVENVKEYSVGDSIEFVLLTRKKDSFAPMRKNDEFGLQDPFSKFTFTQDVDLSVRQAVSELDSWIARANPGAVEDLEKHLYVNAALERLEERRLYWNEQRITTNHSKSRNQMISFSPPDVSRMSKFADGATTSRTNDQDKSDEESQSSLDKSSDNGHSLEEQDAISSSSGIGSKGPMLQQNDTKDLSGSDAYNFYQSVDGQHIILHSLNVRCLLDHYGSYELVPPRVSGKILEMETVTQSEAIRRRYRFLSHFSLTTTFQICEVDMRESLPPDAFVPFLDEIKKRDKQRKERARKDHKNKIKAEVAAAAELVPLMASFGHGPSSHDDYPPFSLDDFEALGNSAPISSSPPNIGERSSFSNVTRLGFAAGHDSPNLSNDEPTSVQSSSSNEIANTTAGVRNTNVTSFASVTSRTPSAPVAIKEPGKRGKKQNRVLLSTTSVRRY